MFEQLGAVLNGAPAERERMPVRRQSRAAGKCEAVFWRRTNSQDVRKIVLAARRYELAGRQPGSRNGPLGGVAIELLELFANLVNFRTGRLDPSIETLMRYLKRSRDAIVRALTHFEAIFDVSELPALWEQDCYMGTKERDRLARAYHALRDISKGRFEPSSQDEDGERPCVLTPGFVDPYYLDALLWVCGLPSPFVAASSPFPVPSAEAELRVMPSRRLRSIELCAGAV